MSKSRRLARLAIAAVVLSLAGVGAARAQTDTDGYTKLDQVNVTPQPITCTFSQGTPTTNTTNFSFDISWIDKNNRAYFLADRSHGNPSSDTQGGVLTGATDGDVLYIDINSHTVTPLDPPTNDPFAGVRCDANATFGGTNSAGRNEITGPNGVFTVNSSEAWTGDGPSRFNPGQTNTAADYATDPCDSSVRVFNLISRQQTDHINLHGCFRTDEGAFDPKDQVALFANPSEQPLPGNPNAKALNNAPFISLISTIPVGPQGTHNVLKQINFDGTGGTVNANGGIEQAVWSKDTGYFYISIPGNSANPTGGFVTVVDPEHKGSDGSAIHVVGNYALNNCSPSGAALGPNFQLLLGCGSGPEQVIDIRDGHVVAVLTGTTGGCDEVAYNKGDNHFYGACTDSNAGGTDNFDLTDAGPPPVFDTAINTGAVGAHSVTADPITITGWVPAYAGLCGSGQSCVMIFGSQGGNDNNKNSIASSD